MHERVKGMRVIQMGEKENKEEKPFQRERRRYSVQKGHSITQKVLGQDERAS